MQLRCSLSLDSPELVEGSKGPYPKDYPVPELVEGGTLKPFQLAPLGLDQETRRRRDPEMRERGGEGVKGQHQDWETRGQGD